MIGATAFRERMAGNLLWRPQTSAGHGLETETGARRRRLSETDRETEEEVAEKRARRESEDSDGEETYIVEHADDSDVRNLVSSEPTQIKSPRNILRDQRELLKSSVVLLDQGEKCVYGCPELEEVCNVGYYQIHSIFFYKNKVYKNPQPHF